MRHASMDAAEVSCHYVVYTGIGRSGAEEGKRKRVWWRKRATHWTLLKQYKCYQLFWNILRILWLHMCIAQCPLLCANSYKCVKIMITRTYQLRCESSARACVFLSHILLFIISVDSGFCAQFSFLSVCHRRRNWIRAAIMSHIAHVSLNTILLLNARQSIWSLHQSAHAKVSFAEKDQRKLSQLDYRLLYSLVNKIIRSANTRFSGFREASIGVSVVSRFDSERLLFVIH